MDGSRAAPVAMVLAMVAASAAATVSHEAPDFSGSPRQRKALFEDLLERSLAFDALNPEKVAALELDFAEQAASMKRDFLRADHETALYLALCRFSNLRRTHGLRVGLLDDGLRVVVDIYETPVRFGFDSDPEAEHPFFIDDHDVDIQRKLNTTAPRNTQVERGDMLLQVEGKPVEDFLESLDPYLQYGSVEQRGLEAARALSLKRHDLDLKRYENDVTFTMQKEDGKKYKLRVPYIDDTWSLNWVSAVGPARDRGFRLALNTPSFRVYTPGPGQAPGMVWIEARTLDQDTEDDVERLVSWAEEEGVLGSKVLFDLSGASGEEVPWALLRMLIDQPLEPSLGMLRLGPQTPLLVESLRRDASDELKAWLEDVVLPAHAKGEEWAGPVPHRLEVPELDENARMPPAKKRFTGGKVLLVGRSSSPAVNHLAAMWIDGGVGPSVGLPPTGSGCAWKWREEIALPREDRPLVSFSWCTGIALRPSGEVLESHPPQPGTLVPYESGNHEGWERRALELALKKLGESGS